MVLGISSFTYGWSAGVNGSHAYLTEHELVVQTVAFGLKCLQLGDNFPLHKIPAERLANLKTSIHDNGIRLEVGARRLTEEHLHRYIEITEYFKSPLLRFVIDADNYEPDDKTIVSILRNALPDLKKQKITLGIENHDRFKAKELSKIMDTISDDHIGICLDTVNSIGAGEGLHEVTEWLAPFTVNLHIKDFTIRRFPHNMGFTVTGAPAGKGMLDLPFLMEKLEKFDRCQSAILEQWVTPEPQLEETIKKERQWADESIRYLKDQIYFKTNT
jgi:3-oxoisoapionate decarboxylase